MCACVCVCVRVCVCVCARACVTLPNKVVGEGVGVGWVGGNKATPQQHWMEGWAV